MAAAVLRHMAHAVTHLHFTWIYSESEEGVNSNVLIKQAHPNKITNTNKHVPALMTCWHANPALLTWKRAWVGGLRSRIQVTSIRPPLLLIQDCAVVEWRITLQRKAHTHTAMLPPHTSLIPFFFGGHNETEPGGMVFNGNGLGVKGENRTWTLHCRDSWAQHW